MNADELPPPSPPSYDDSPLRRDRGAIIGAVILILAGVYFLLANFYPQVVGRSFLLLLGIAFLLAYFLGRHNVGFLIPGGILAGLGLGIILEPYVASPASEGVVPFFLGLGFILIWLFSRRHFWALIVGGILAIIGAAIIVGRAFLFIDVGRYWPILLILLGIWVLVQRARAAGGVR